MSVEYTEIKQIISEKDILYTIKSCFIGDSSTIEDRKELMWNCFNNKQQKMPEDLSQNLALVLNIKGKIGRVTLENYDNFVNRNSSYFPFKNVTIAVVVFNSQDDSYKNIKNWHGEVSRYCGSYDILQTIIVGMFPDETYHQNLPENIQMAISSIPNSKFFYYYPSGTDEFRKVFFSTVVKIRELLFSDEKLNEIKSVKQKRTIVQKKIIAPQVTSTISSSMNRKLKLASRNEDELVILLKAIVLGDESVSNSCHRITQHILGLPEAIGDDIYEYPQHLIQKENMTIRLRMDVYNHNIPSGKSYTPYFNTLISIIVFRYDDKESFKNVVNWYQETQRYSNLQSNHYFIVGCQYNDTEQIIKDQDTENLLNYISKQKEIQFFKVTGSNWDDLTNKFFSFVDDVCRIEFSKEFLQQCAGLTKNAKHTLTLDNTQHTNDRNKQYRPFILDEENSNIERDEESGSLLGRERNEEPMEFEYSTDSCCCILF
ncbi:hypothetical protein ENUP19_0053G0013 [Entamoeba nuttalli]|uniref:Uncharacterized protein n=1 Tax=Entamoeba nuttalli TaxID=412467 RepID=A0ABQ0DC40_9EUKA